MHRNLIVGYDGSDQAHDALALAEVLAQSEHARLVVACEYPLRPRSAVIDPVFDREVRVGAEATVAGARELLRDPDAAEYTAVLSSSAAAGLKQLAEERNAIALVVGSSRRGPIGRALPGSVATWLLGSATCAVAVAPSGYARMRPSRFALIGAAVVPSPESRSALHTAERIAARLGAGLRVITVAKSADEVEEASYVLDDTVASAPIAVRAEGRLPCGDPAKQLVLATETLDLLVCGTRGHGPAGQLLLGSVSRHLVGHAHCPVLIVPRGAGGDLPAAVAPTAVSAA